MKKEIIACVLLLTLAAGCVCNIRYLNRLCTQLDDAAAQAEACCAAHDTDSAAEALRTAAERWHAAESYAHCMLPHESTDAMTEGFCQAVRALESGAPSAAADIALLRLRIQGLADGERVALGNVF